MRYAVTCYIDVQNPQGAAELVEYLEESVDLDLDTEENGNPHGVTSLEIDWDTLKKA